MLLDLVVVCVTDGKLSGQYKTLQSAAVAAASGVV